MSTAKEFWDKVSSDSEFAAKVSDIVVSEVSGNAKDYDAAIVTAAERFGYEVKPADIRAIIEEQNEDLSADELGKVGGGTVIPTLTPYSTFFVTKVTLSPHGEQL